MGQNQDTIVISKDIYLVPLSEHVYVHSSYHELPQWGRILCNGMLVVNQQNAYLFDTPMSDSLTQKLLYFLRDSMHINVKGFVPNHWHEDCTAGLKSIHRFKIESVSHDLTNECLRKEQLPTTRQTFRDSLHIDLNDLSIHCYYPGQAHSIDNIVAWVPSDRILFAGCMVRPVDAKGLGYTNDGNVEAWPNTLHLLLKRYGNANAIIPGHGATGNLELIEHTLQLLQQK